jgi:hypothetical protein
MIIGMAGCTDLSTLLRDEIALESEVMDRIAFVVDENSAKVFNKSFSQWTNEKTEKINKEKLEIVNFLDKVPKKIWDGYDELLNNWLKGKPGEPSPTDAEILAKIAEMGKPEAPTECVKEIGDVLWEKLKRSQKPEDPPLPRPDVPVKGLNELPSPKLLTYYMRERLALKLARKREETRLREISGPEVDRVISFFVNKR